MFKNHQPAFGAVDTNYLVSQQCPFGQNRGPLTGMPSLNIYHRYLLHKRAEQPPLLIKQPLANGSPRVEPPTFLSTVPTAHGLAERYGQPLEEVTALCAMRHHLGMLKNP